MCSSKNKGHVIVCLKLVLRLTYLRNDRWVSQSLIWGFSTVEDSLINVIYIRLYVPTTNLIFNEDYRVRFGSNQTIPSSFTSNSNNKKPFEHSGHLIAKRLFMTQSSYCSQLFCYGKPVGTGTGLHLNPTNAFSTITYTRRVTCRPVPAHTSLFLGNWCE